MCTPAHASITRTLPPTPHSRTWAMSPACSRHADVFPMHLRHVCDEPRHFPLVAPLLPYVPRHPLFSKFLILPQLSPASLPLQDHRPPQEPRRHRRPPRRHHGEASRALSRSCHEVSCPCATPRALVYHPHPPAHPAFAYMGYAPRMCPTRCNFPRAFPTCL